MRAIGFPSLKKNRNKEPGRKTLEECVGDGQEKGLSMAANGVTD